MSLPSDAAWVIIAMVAVATVVLSLAVLGTVVEYELGLRRLRRKIREMKNPLRARRP